MRFRLYVNMDNETFSEGGEELAAILRRLAERLETASTRAPDSGKVRDTNGNTVGDWVIGEPVSRDDRDKCAELGIMD